jgi:hypothetical protein
VDLKREERERRLVEIGLHHRVERLDNDHAAELPHAYGLFVDVPIDAKVLRTLEKRVLDFARSGETTETALDQDEAVESVLRDLGGKPDINDPNVQFALAQIVPTRVRVRIKRFPGPKGIMLMSGPSGIDTLPHSSDIAGNIAANIDYAVRRILEAKVPKMKALPTGQRKVLLVWSDYALADAKEVSRAIGQFCPNDGDLDGVFFIDSGWKTVSLVANFTNFL